MKNYKGLPTNREQRQKPATVTITVSRYDDLLRAETFMEGIKQKLAALDTENPCLLVYPVDIPRRV